MCTCRKSSEQTDESTPLKYLVDRNVMQYEELTKLSEYDRQKATIRDSIKSGAHEFSCTRLIKATVPVIEWLPQYSFKKYLMGDIMAGVTVAVMHIPQGRPNIYEEKKTIPCDKLARQM